MNSPPEAQTGTIRPMQHSDLEQVLVWRNHPEIARYMLNPGPISLADHQAWFARSQQLGDRHLLIYQHAEVRGFVQFQQLDQGDIADWGFYLAPGSPRGAGHGLARAALAHAFGPLKLHKVCGQVLSNNPRSLAFHERHGFVREGVLREQQQRDGERLDLICFGLLRRDWQAMQNSAEPSS